MPPHNARGRAKSLIGACGARVTRGACKNRDEEDGDNHQELVMGGGANAPGENVGGVPPAGLRPSIRNKITGNLIKVYSTMVSSAAAIEETLNKTRKIQNPKSQREGTSN
ncbi:hypothetical protein Acr_00g0074770 [Actinidia rufa]|uniref:Uncharacterized protein n=1 Tax=Actinidia rufa TaxID=165716 RepID=A0A7J0DSM6_9ERIC|nr:hypothetical protein Acr_00g0074770 [Actinidia rufa]